ncbi:hypothetical protein HZA45_00870 [Candidatus Peregrinibacteria bacterium]|nr:hypothetical protein [Candidatus Peregrinibacteria bacterium]
MARYEEKVTKGDLWFVYFLGIGAGLIPVINLILSYSFWQDVRKHKVEGKWPWEEGFPERKNGVMACGIWTGSAVFVLTAIAFVVFVVYK